MRHACNSIIEVRHKLKFWMFFMQSSEEKLMSLVNILIGFSHSWLVCNPGSSCQGRQGPDGYKLLKCKHK